MTPSNDIFALLRRTARRAKFAAQYGWRRAYKVEISGVTTEFAVSDPYSVYWFSRHGRDAVYEKAITNHLADLCREKTCFVDVGANLGWFTCITGCHMKEGEVHSFEIDDRTYAVARKNVELNNLKNVHLNLAAVGGKEGDLEYYRRPESISAMTGLTKANSAFSEKVTREMVSLDGFVERKLG